MKRAFCLIVFCAFFLLSGSAFGDDFGILFNASLEKELGEKWGISLEGEVRSQDMSRDLERLSVDANFSYKVLSFLKLDAGYKFIGKYSSAKEDGSLFLDAYWGPRHRAYASVSATAKLGVLKVSLRERYQFTYSSAVEIPVTDGESGAVLPSKMSSEKYEHMLRSRVQFAWNIPGAGFSPHVSLELFNDLIQGFVIDTVRLIVGSEYSFLNDHTLSLFYRYDKDMITSDDSKHFLGIGYGYSF